MNDMSEAERAYWAKLKAEKLARKAAKAQPAIYQPDREWSIGVNESGHNEVVRVRTKREERKHEHAMDRWARNGGGGNFDYSMNY